MIFGKEVQSDMYKRETQLLTNEMVEAGLLKKAQFIFYSESGAMGEGGSIMTVQQDGTVYEGNYVYGALSIDLVIKKFPYIGVKKFNEILQTGTSKDGKVHYYYLECGNHLFVRDAVFEVFKEMVKDCTYCDEIGASWYNAACIICSGEDRM